MRKKKPLRRAAIDRYAPSRRFTELRALLEATGGLTVYELAERLRVSVRTVIRYLRAMEAAKEPLFADRDGARNVWRLMPTARRGSVQLTTQQMVSLYLSRRVLGFLDGTGLKEDLDEVFAKLAATLRRQDFDVSRTLDRKLYDVNEAPHLYDERVDDVDALVTALLREEKLLVRYASARATSTFVLRPYALVVYRKGLYVAGLSEKHGETRLFALDGFEAMEWKKGERFDYPPGFDPAALFAGAFGVIRGEPARVRVRFDARIARSVRRRRWHASQTIATKRNGDVVVTMDVAGIDEVKSWVLGYGAHAEVLEPPELRDALAREARAMSARYDARSAEVAARVV